MKRMNGTENYSSWWRNRNGTLRYFGTGNEKNNGVGQLVSQVITNSDDLPVIEINFGPERDGHGLCSTQFQLGKLVCFGYQGIRVKSVIYKDYKIVITQDYQKITRVLTELSLVEDLYRYVNIIYLIIVLFNCNHSISNDCFINRETIEDRAGVHHEIEGNLKIRKEVH